MSHILVHHINRFWLNQTPAQVSRDTLLFVFTLYYANKLRKTIQDEGIKKFLFTRFLSLVKLVPGAASTIESEKQKVLDKLSDMMASPDTANEVKYTQLPASGVNRDNLLSTLDRWHLIENAKWDRGQVSGGIYHGEKEFLSFLTKAYGMFALSNPLHPDVFPFIRKMEAEVISMTVSLFNGDANCCGTMTAGGTESILMAMKAYRDRGYAHGIKRPEIIAASTAHAAFDKAAHYFQMKLVTIPVDQTTFKIDVNRVRRAINKNTVVIVGSAPHFPQGIIDDIPALSDLALKHKIGLHVDSCLGGFLLPFIRKLGYKTTPFDFSVPGVTSISADTHKYGYAPKGSSVVMYRDAELRHYQYFVAADWTGGIYASPSMPGSRPGGLIAATWAAMVAMGEQGYLECAREIMQAAKAIEAGIIAIDGLRVLGKPDMSVIAFATNPDSARGKKLNIYKIGEAMGTRQWNLNTLQRPASIHICCTYMHRNAAQKFLSDLKDSVQQVLDHPDMFKNGSAAIYGMAESLPDTSMVDEIAKGYIDQMLKA